jgi:hypothetical protein
VIDRIVFTAEPGAAPDRCQMRRWLMVVLDS